MFSLTKFGNKDKYSFKEYLCSDKSRVKKSLVLGSKDMGVSEETLKNIKNFHFPYKLNKKEINNMNDEEVLKEVENTYNLFIEKKCHILLLLSMDNILEEYIDIRDAISMRLEKIIRNNKNIKHLQMLKRKRQNIEKKQEDKEKKQENIYIRSKSHIYKNNFPDELKLNVEYLRNGYIPETRLPMNHKCGCLSLNYIKHKLFDCNHSYEKTYPSIKLIKYCKIHKNMKQHLANFVSEWEKLSYKKN